MLITCPECSNKVSEAAASCPQCGLKKPGNFCEEKAIEKAKSKMYRCRIGMKYGSCDNHLLAKMVDSFVDIGISPSMYITDINVVKIKVKNNDFDSSGYGEIVGIGYDVEFTTKCKSCGVIKKSLDR